jgi:lipopolysaccharide transport system ATP-binding protein
MFGMPSFDLAVSVNGISKSYELSRQSVRHTTLGEALIHRLKHPFQGGEKTTFWALQGVNFEVNKGDVVGVIGRNGAGKSTLLKIISRIVEPTTGQIDLYGRVGSLLEVGTGFHPELTGRENIYLNGSILGMRRAEITKQFDAIVDFSGVSQFLDTPVKRYSSGMYVRLAFAVAAHLEPEILIVDEVLAVGDAEFQNRCLGKMRDVASSGRTVLFVSHNMQAVSLLCNRGVVLQNGKVTFQGDASEAVQEYLNGAASQDQAGSDPDRRRGSGEYRFVRAAPTSRFFDGAGVKEVAYRIEHRRGRLGRMYLSAHLVNDAGVVLAQFDSRFMGHWMDDAEAIEGTFRFTAPWLKPGDYRIDLYVCASGGVVDFFEPACSINISQVLPYPFSASRDGTQSGLVLGEFEWESSATRSEVPVGCAVP